MVGFPSPPGPTCPFHTLPSTSISISFSSFLLIPCPKIVSHYDNRSASPQQQNTPSLILPFSTLPCSSLDIDVCPSSWAESSGITADSPSPLPLEGRRHGFHGGRAVGWTLTASKTDEVPSPWCGMMEGHEGCSFTGSLEGGSPSPGLPGGRRPCGQVFNRSWSNSRRASSLKPQRPGGRPRNQRTSVPPGCGRPRRQIPPVWGGFWC